MKYVMERVNKQRKLRFFVDTNILVSALDEKETTHSESTEFFRIIKINKGLIVVSSLVLIEFLQILFKKNYEMEIIKNIYNDLIGADNFAVMDINDSQMIKVLSQILDSGLNLKSSDLYISATAIYFDTIFLTLDDQIYRNVYEIYDDIFCDPVVLKEKLTG